MVNHSEQKRKKIEQRERRKMRASRSGGDGQDLPSDEGEMHSGDTSGGEEKETAKRRHQWGLMQTGKWNYKMQTATGGENAMSVKGKANLPQGMAAQN